ncbi:PopZ family protein [Pseudaminobacter sp. NGMCC 1.201702]|uniref:PopZ family protein n=1 Tax=Pseudaminobacter sp. NGMCC 1.201702 TaxID=3391825 RepID=UPI0039EE4ABA
MEEILASIRRIIEDSDTARKEGELGAAGEGSESRLDNAVIEVDAFRAELRAAQNDAGKPVNLAEVQARIADEPQPDVKEAHLGHDAQATTGVEAQPDVAPKASVESSTFAVPVWNIPAEKEPAPAASGVVESAYDDQLEAALGDLSIEQAAADQPEPTPEPAAPTVDSNFAVNESRTETPSSGGAESPRPAILSEHAGRQVAAAFGELSEAFAARSRKTFDDMAAEMMRPMLQDWLDNNLPTLVERLVREEIERVARGAQ